MLEDVPGIWRGVLACGTVDLRKGIDGLAMIIGDKYRQPRFEKGTLFLFCGQRSDRIKGLVGALYTLTFLSSVIIILSISEPIPYFMEKSVKP